MVFPLCCIGGVDIFRSVIYTCWSTAHFDQIIKRPWTLVERPMLSHLTPLHLHTQDLTHSGNMWSASEAVTEHLQHGHISPSRNHKVLPTPFPPANHPTVLTTFLFHTKKGSNASVKIQLLHIWNKVSQDNTKWEPKWFTEDQSMKQNQNNSVLRSYAVSSCFSLQN